MPWMSERVLYSSTTAATWAVVAEAGRRLVSWWMPSSSQERVLLLTYTADAALSPTRRTPRPGLVPREARSAAPWRTSSVRVRARAAPSRIRAVMRVEAC